MRIWVDADACPAVVKEILYRVADRMQMQVTLVANQLLRVPPSRFIRAVQVPSGADVADQEIVRLLAPGNLVVTGDIPLASDVLKKVGYALNPQLQPTETVQCFVCRAVVTPRQQLAPEYVYEKSCPACFKAE